MKRAIEEDFPSVEINRLAAPERNAFKPIYQMHKWFARRASASVVRVSANGQCSVDESGFDAERLENSQTAPSTAPLKLPLEAEARTEEAIRLWTASRRTEMPEGTIVRCDLLGVSVVT